ncbi:unnamed protein product [Rhizoctonia solani]|uniref:F-box domain-containing protein n=1 Tax=Rhizoctonia solani TaxID=456999 RepID=A0A8H3CXB6_9AGAM|nr:unnamed protein product [Rhizoctonia solani]CAE6501438.1 unnamed protein product [Rhizoctonia solani]
MAKAKQNKPQTPCSSALLKWEAAGKKLATALSAYLQSCVFLDTFCAAPSQDAKTVASRVDIALNALHPNLFEELSQSQVSLARMRNRVSSPFYSLPGDVLAEIFKDAVYIPTPDDKPFPPMADGLTRIFSRLHNLLAVCSTWRNTAVELSDLWSVIPVAHELSTRPTPRSASLTLERSRALTSDRCRLHLAAVLPDRFYGHIAPFAEGKIPQFTSINIEARFRSPTPYISDLLDNLLESQSPAVMSELSIHHYEDPLEDSPPRPPKTNEYLDFTMPTEKKLISSLSAFRLRRINVHWNTITLSDKLVEIHLQSVMLGSNAKLVEFLHALEPASELRDLRLVSVVAFAGRATPIDSNAAPRKISLPKLQSLLLDDLAFNVLQTVLTSIAPGTHKLKVHPTSKSHYNLSGEEESDSDDDFFQSPNLMSLLNRFNIDTLLLSPGDDYNGEDGSPWVDREELSRKLRLLPNLKTLIMYSWKWDLGAILALDRTFSRSIPVLSGLYIFGGYICDAELLPKVVASHSLQTLVLDSHPTCTVDVNRELLLRSLKAMVPDFRLVRGLEGMDEFNYYSWRLW